MMFDHTNASASPSNSGIGSGNTAGGVVDSDSHPGGHPLALSGAALTSPPANTPSGSVRPTTVRTYRVTSPPLARPRLRADRTGRRRPRSTIGRPADAVPSG